MKNLLIKNAIANKLKTMIYYGHIIHTKINQKNEAIFISINRKLHKSIDDDYFSIRIFIDNRNQYRISIYLKKAYSIKQEAAKEAFLFELNYLFLWLRGSSYELILPLKPKNEEEFKIILSKVKDILLRYSDYDKDSAPEPITSDFFDVQLKPKNKGKRHDKKNKRPIYSKKRKNKVSNKVIRKMSLFARVVDYKTQNTNCLKIKRNRVFEYIYHLQYKYFSS